MASTPRGSPIEPSCLFPDETEIARLVLGPKRAKAWSGLAVVLERSGLPRVDVMFGGRYWPAVRAFLDHYHHANREPRVALQPEGIAPTPGPAAYDHGGRPIMDDARAPPAPRRSCLPLGLLPRGLSREQAAEYCGCESLAAFDDWVRRGNVPKAMAGTIPWDRKAIDRALDRRSGLLFDGGPSIEEWLREHTG